MDQADRQNLARQVFESPLSGLDVDSYLREALDQAYWQRLNPALSICTQRPAMTFETAPLDEPQVARQLERLQREGYFQTPPVLAPDVLRRMRLAIDTIRAKRWPAVFAYVYDEFWEVVRSPSLVTLISRFLGEGYRQNSRIWAFYVPAARGARGWHPHADSGDESRLTVWLPLTEATLDNGCMYLIPRDRLPDDLLGNYLDLESVSRAQLDRLLQSTKALPSPAGAYLGWNHEVIHWGSVSTGHGDPRVSLAVEFVGPGVGTLPDESPLFEGLTTLPPFAERLRAIARGLRVYASYEPANMKFAELGRLLAGRIQ